MKFRIIKPFVVEMFTFVFVISSLFICLLMCNLIEVIIHVHLLTVTAISFVFISFISLFSKIVTTGFSALFDFFFQNIREGEYIFLEEQPYRASIFTEKFGHDHEPSYGVYYLIHVKKENEIRTFISPSYVELIKDEMYLIKFGKSSKILIECRMGDGSLS